MMEQRDTGLLLVVIVIGLLIALELLVYNLGAFRTLHKPNPAGLIAQRDQVIATKAQIGGANEMHGSGYSYWAMRDGLRPATDLQPDRRRPG